MAFEGQGVNTKHRHLTFCRAMDMITNKYTLVIVTLLTVLTKQKCYLSLGKSCYSLEKKKHCLSISILYLNCFHEVRRDHSDNLVQKRQISRFSHQRYQTKSDEFLLYFCTKIFDSISPPYGTWLLGGLEIE